jgi:hypothetical protein
MKLSTVSTRVFSFEAHAVTPSEHLWAVVQVDADDSHMMIIVVKWFTQGSRRRSLNGTQPRFLHLQPCFHTLVSKTFSSSFSLYDTSRGFWYIWMLYSPHRSVALSLLAKEDLVTTITFLSLVTQPTLGPHVLSPLLLSLHRSRLRRLCFYSKHSPSSTIAPGTKSLFKQANSAYFHGLLLS